ncbi:MAG: GTP-binding protein [Syntrophaceae bacterium]|nr:GTP-binding protein [Syntrophaceae bacterium]
MTRFKIFCFAFSVLFLFLSACHHSVSDPSANYRATGLVIDDAANKPLADAIITLNDKEMLRTGQDGTFPIKADVRRLAVRAYGYTRAERIININKEITTLEIRLKPIKPKAIYLTGYGIASRRLRESALKLIETTELNTLVIDVKGDRGFIPYPSEIPLVSSIGGQKLILFKDIKGLVATLKSKGIYTVARIVVFKDNLLGMARPELTIRTTGGAVWRDRENLIWVDPSQKEVWDYNIAIAIEAAKNGFDEIQFDYVRFPDSKGLKFALPNTEENRSAAISGFLHAAREKLAPYNVFIAADVFGYVAWNLNDTNIGQKIDQIASAVDYISLMLYPSGFRFGIPGYRNPVANSNRIVYLTLRRAQERTKIPSVRFRPWLQAFRDYAFDRRHFTSAEIQEQIRASEDFGTNGWMLWNPRNVYTAEGLKPENREETAMLEQVVLRQDPGVTWKQVVLRQDFGVSK